MSQESTTGIEPVIKERTVPLPVEQAFARFTEGIAGWWPVDTHSVAAHTEAEVETVVMEAELGGRIYERQRNGNEYKWGVVTHWEPPARVAFTWHPGQPDLMATQVDVTFAAEGDGTRVRLVHTGWEKFAGRAAEVRAGYDGGWESVLDLYVGV